MSSASPEIIEQNEELTKRVGTGYLRIPLNEEKFGDFIQGLLGSSQSISKLITGSFEIQGHDIKNLYHLIVQRVRQQNGGKLLKFTTKIVFSDNSNVELNSLEGLESYHEYRPVVSKAVYLKWDFLVKFPDKDIPEKQQIQVSFAASGDEIPMIDEDFLKYRMILRDGPGTAGFRIEHTARSWGADIEALLSAQIKSLMKPKSVIKNFIRKNNSKISLGVSSLFFSATLFISFSVTQHFSDLQAKRMSELLIKSNNATLVDLNSNLNYLAQFVASGSWSAFYFKVLVFTIISLFLAIALGIWVESATDNYEPSFLLLTDESIKHKETVTKRIERKWLSFIFAILTSIMCGVVGNIIFTKIASSY
jgi:hypothetical protein